MKRKNTARAARSTVHGLAGQGIAFARGRAWAWSVVVSLVGILFCVYVALLLYQQSQEAALQRFNYLIERFEKRLSDRFSSFDLVVNMGMGMATLTDYITRRDWQRFVSGLNWREMSGGIGLNYVERVKRADLDRYLKRATVLNGETFKIRSLTNDVSDDLDGWVRLARAYQVLQRSDDSRAAWAKAAALAPARLDIQLDYADAIVAGRSDLDRYLPPEFVEAVGRVRTLDPKNPLGLYYGGLVARVAGNTEEARRLWTEVLEQLPPDAPQRAELRKELDSLQP